MNNMSKGRVQTFGWCRNYVKILWISVCNQYNQKTFSFLSAPAKSFICLAVFLILSSSVLDWSKPKLYRYTWRRCGAGQIAGSHFSGGFAVLRNHPECWEYCDFNESSSLVLLWCQLHLEFCLFSWSFQCLELRNSVQNRQFDWTSC